MKPIPVNNLLLCITLIVIFLSGCEKKSFDPSIYEKPVVYFNAEFNGKPFDFTINDAKKYAGSSIIDDSVMRYFIMHLNNPAEMEVVRLVFNNHTASLSDAMTDLTHTISVGTKEYTQFIPPPFNPMQTGCVAIEYQDKKGNLYSSIPVMVQNGSFSIDSVYQIKWVNGKYYKMFHSSFECKLYNVFVADSIIIKNGSALLAFELE
jgi:hypothetical protein